MSLSVRDLPHTMASNRIRDTSMSMKGHKLYKLFKKKKLLESIRNFIRSYHGQG
jgi:hypothetical protein